METQPVPEADAAAMAARLSQETDFEEPNLGEEETKLLRRNQLELKQASKDEDGECADGQKPAKVPRGRKPKNGPKTAAKAKAKAVARAKASARAKAKAAVKAKAEDRKTAKSRARKNQAADPGDAASVPGPAAEPKRRQKKAKHAAGPEVDRAVAAADAAKEVPGRGKCKCFAKRRMPSTPFQRDKFVAIRAAFESKIKPLLTTFSAHEDCLPKVSTLLLLEVSGWVSFKTLDSIYM